MPGNAGGARHIHPVNASGGAQGIHHLRHHFRHGQGIKIARLEGFVQKKAALDGAEPESQKFFMHFAE